MSDPICRLLATYMGHVSIVSTERYLHFVQELAGPTPVKLRIPRERDHSFRLIVTAHSGRR